MEKKNNAWWYIAGAAGGAAGVLAMLALRRKKKRNQTKSEIIHTILTNQGWRVGRTNLREYNTIHKDDIWSFFDNGMVLDLGSKKDFQPEQRQYDSIGSWTLFGKVLEVKWRGPNDFSAYKWKIEVLKPDRLRLHSVETNDTIELVAFDTLGEK